MEPIVIGIFAASICVIFCTIAAAISIKVCGPALAAVTSERPELGKKMIITIILGEALAIYGLLIAFMILSRIPSLNSNAEALNLLSAAITMVGTAISASIGIAYCGPAFMTALVAESKSFTINILGLILSEALAIYGLLIAFMIIGQ